MICLLDSLVFLFCFCFFFQAEDGIRDSPVTGVQTCALPICAVGWHRRESERSISSRDFAPDTSSRSEYRLQTVNRQLAGVEVTTSHQDRKSVV